MRRDNRPEARSWSSSFSPAIQLDGGPNVADLQGLHGNARSSVGLNWLCAALLVSALLLGGGGSPAPLPELLLELIVGVVFAFWFVNSPARALVPGQVWAIALLVAIVPLVQLVPLPPALWQALPGRELARDALALIGREQDWHSWSLAPGRTLASLLALGPPLAVLIMTSTLDRSARIGLLGVICAVGLLSLMVGVLQLTGGDFGFLRFYGPSDGFLTGFQANRNSTADRFVIAMIAAPALVFELVRSNRFPMSRALVFAVSAGLAVLFAIGVVLTASRTGIVLMVPALVAGTIVLRSWLRLQWRHLVLVALATACAATAATWLLWYKSAFVHAAERFALAGELRPELWKDSLYTARQYFPFGAGMGDFVPAFTAGERLEMVRQTYTNRAHNDFLELVVEAGIFGIAALCIIVAMLTSAAGKAFRRAGTGGGAMVLFAMSVLFVLAVHSLVDYPLRSMALACLAAMCAGMLFEPRREPRTSGRELEETMERT